MKKILSSFLLILITTICFSTGIKTKDEQQNLKRINKIDHSIYLYNKTLSDCLDFKLVQSSYKKRIISTDLNNRLLLTSIDYRNSLEPFKYPMKLPYYPTQHKSGGMSIGGKIFLGALIGSGMGLFAGMIACADGDGSFAPWVAGGAAAGIVSFFLLFP